MRQALLFVLAAAAPAAVPNVPTPPSGHPRLYLRAGDIAELKTRTTHPATRGYWEKMEQASARIPGIAAETDALRYLMSADTAAGRRAAVRALELLRTAEFDSNQQDVTRPIGRMVVTGSVVYDWCFPLLTVEERAAFQERLLHWVKRLECGYPPPTHHGVTGHYSEWMLMRDMLSAGVALYDDFPEMYNVAADRFFTLFKPVRDWWYRGGAFHQGSAYAETRGSSELYPLWIFARMGAGAVYDPALQQLPYSWIYMRRPDGQLLRSGDGQSKAPKLRSLLNASFYKDPYVLGDYLRDPDLDPHSLLFAFLWRDLNLQPKLPDDLPLARYMGTPYGWMVARTGWGDDAVIAEMKVNEYNFNNHQHLDAGAFQIYYKGPLAIDSGVYQGYGSEHDVNYNKRTIAHNSLLIHDPAETFVRSKREMRNDGGQRFPNGWREPASLEDMLKNYRTGTVLGQAIAPAYAYLKGDITQAYSTSKVSDVRRSFVFLNLAAAGSPVKAALIVFDRVVSARPEFAKTWLLHSMEEPTITGPMVMVAPRERGWTGKLVDTVVLPERATITPVGGPGKEYWVSGENYPAGPPRGNPLDSEFGAWRVEVRPPDGAREDLFLNAMQVMDRDAAPLPVARVDAPGRAGVRIAGTTVLFARDGQASAGPVSFQSEGGRFLAADLAEGEWTVARAGGASSKVRVTKDAGALWFEGPAGRYTLRR